MRDEKGKYFDCRVGAIVGLRVFLDIDVIVFFGLHDTASHNEVKEDIEAQCSTDYIECLVRLQSIKALSLCSPTSSILHLWLPLASFR